MQDWNILNNNMVHVSKITMICYNRVIKMKVGFCEFCSLYICNWYVFNKTVVLFPENGNDSFTVRLKKSHVDQNSSGVVSKKISPFIICICKSAVFLQSVAWNIFCIGSTATQNLYWHTSTGQMGWTLSWFSKEKHGRSKFFEKEEHANLEMGGMNS